MQTRLVETMIEHCDWLFQDVQDDTPTTTPPSPAPAGKPLANMPTSASMEGFKKPQPQTTETPLLIAVESGPIAAQPLPQPLPPPKAPKGSEDVIITPPPATGRPAQRPPPAIPRPAPPTPPRPYADEKISESPKSTQIESRGVSLPRQGEDGGPRPIPAVRPRPSVRQPKKPVMEREQSAPAVMAENNVPTEIMFVIDTDGEQRDIEVAPPLVTGSEFVCVLV